MTPALRRNTVGAEKSSLSFERGLMDVAGSRWLELEELVA